MSNQRYGKKTYMQLGMVLMKKHPDVAQSLLPYCQTKPTESLEHLPDYFKRFCEYYQINPLEHVGKLPTAEKQRIRRVFIGSMLTIYDEKVFHQSEIAPIIYRGFVARMAELLSAKPSRISLLIRQIMFEERTYPDFAEEITNTVAHLKTFNYGKTEKSKPEGPEL